MSTISLTRGIAPEHPGVILRELYVEPLELNNQQVAENLGVTRVTVNKILNGKQSITAEMAIRLSKAFKTSPELWMNLQQGFDLWMVYASQKTKFDKIESVYDKINKSQGVEKFLDKRKKRSATGRSGAKNKVNP